MSLFIELLHRRRPLLTGLVVVLLATLIGGGSAFTQGKGKKPSPKAPSTPESEYATRFKGAEATLAAGDRPYLILDLKKSIFHVKIRGVTMRDYSYTLLSGPDGVQSFAKLASSTDSVAKSMIRLHVFESERQLNDTVLGIVSEATTAPAALIQRYRPGHLSVTFQNRLALDVHVSDATGTSASWTSNLAEHLRLLADNILGGESLTILIRRDDAMSFYGACQSAPPLLVAP